MSLLLVALAASPLSVRVLEKEHPTTLELTGATLRCDGKPLTGPVEVRAGARELFAGALRCEEISGVEATVTVAASQLKRSYPGLLRLSLESSVIKLLNEVDVEDYLPGVVEAEASGAKSAALEAQAIVSRTWALASRRRHGTAGYDLCDLAHCQLYRGRGEASEASRGAVGKSKGLVLLTGSVALRPAFFHAACGGHTSRAQDVFGEEGAGDAVTDVEKGVTRCHLAPDFEWTFTIDRPKLAAALGLKDEGNALEVLRRDGGGRIIELKAFGRRLSAGDFLSRLGRAVGWSEVKSAHFSVQELEGVLHFTGRGRGHGVGLCQEGAKWLAEQGVDAAGILQRYFPGTRLAPAP
jgi:stage II sporulation protein D